MYAEPVMVLGHGWSVKTAAAAVEGLDDRTIVVVRHATPEHPAYYALDVGLIRAVVEDVDPDADLGAVLDLGLLPANATVGLDDLLETGEVQVRQLRPGDVLLRGVDVVGVVRADASEVQSRGHVGVIHPGGTVTGAAVGLEGRPALVGDATAGPGTPRRRFRAFAALDAPRAVSVGERFTLSVGFSDHPRGDEDEQPIIVPGAPPQLSFIVQVAGFGFTFPDGIRRTLTVERDEPTQGRVEFTAMPQPVTRRTTRTFEVSFEYDGERCGQAWHDVIVSRQGGGAGTGGPVRDAEATRTGGTGVSLAVDGRPPSLTVEIRSEPGSAQLEWVFHTREGVDRPTYRVTSDLEEPSAQRFAEMVMAQLPGATGTAALPSVVRGMGKVVTRPIPIEFWDAVEATWQTVADGETPSLLLITAEPFIPWELAWVDAESVDPALFPDGMAEGPLGAMWQVGRWVPPVRRRRGPDRPAVPPPPDLEVDALAVVIGDYAADQGIRQLPHAVDEGRYIALRYRGLPLTVSEGDVDRLMTARLERDGTRFAPDAVHFAGHGEVGAEQQEYTGIILTGGRRLDILTVEGSLLGGTSRPFVFLNACQVGTASSILSSYGGLAGAFLAAGCRGFLAPLWDVDDAVAKQIALTFYEATLQQGLPVGEAVRRIRAGFGDGASGTATALAYVYYGHPELRMSWTGRAGGTADDDGSL